MLFLLLVVGDLHQVVGPQNNDIAKPTCELDVNECQHNMIPILQGE
jgi:hypothetical protein